MGKKLDSIIVVRGAGDLATGVIARLAASGFLVVALETAKPTAIRRKVAISECMYDGISEVEGIRGIKVHSLDEAVATARIGIIPVLEDPQCRLICDDPPLALIDAIIAKRNLGTDISMAPIVIALGPGFVAGIDAHAVIETNRGHNLGRVLLNGSAEPNTNQPGIIEGYGIERVVRAPIGGTVKILRDIGEIVGKGEPILAIADGDGEKNEAKGQVVVRSPLSGMIRGMIRQGSEVSAGFKLADVDPRGSLVDASTISDKARAIGGGVLEALLHFGGRPS
ncbi:MAG: EF2563 family selenium-dependent molybdenum hydroxylase system protein [Spirochaetaceae bacterium]|nr:EF2563 family selenium-dependent molybdenum hydroxylase system protein [Spirochaetaceae bacterium]